MPFLLHYGDMTDSTNLIRLMHQVRPTEIYNLAAQSHVGVSFESPEYTANADAIGVLRLLEAIRILGMENETRFYQASTSELYGLVQEVPQKETTPFYPRSPYAVAKLYGYWITVNYREAYGITAHSLSRQKYQPFAFHPPHMTEDMIRLRLRATNLSLSTDSSKTHKPSLVIQLERYDSLRILLFYNNRFGAFECQPTAYNIPRTKALHARIRSPWAANARSES